MTRLMALRVEHRCQSVDAERRALTERIDADHLQLTIDHVHDRRSNKQNPHAGAASDWRPTCPGSIEYNVGNIGAVRCPSSSVANNGVMDRVAAVDRATEPAGSAEKMRDNRLARSAAPVLVAPVQGQAVMNGDVTSTDFERDRVCGRTASRSVRQTACWSRCLSAARRRRSEVRPRGPTRDWRRPRGGTRFPRMHRSAPIPTETIGGRIQKTRVGVVLMERDRATSHRRMLQQEGILQQADGRRAEEMTGDFRDAVVQMPEPSQRCVLAGVGVKPDAARVAARHEVGCHDLVKDAIQLRKVRSRDDAAQDEPAARLELGATILGRSQPGRPAWAHNLTLWRGRCSSDEKQGLGDWSGGNDLASTTTVDPFDGVTLRLFDFSTFRPSTYPLRSVSGS